MDSILSDLKVFVPNYFVKFLNLIQWFIDIVLEATVGFTTKRGWKKDREDSELLYEKSAQLVNDDYF